MPDGQYDPADDPRPEAAVRTLADLLGNVSALDAAQGIMDMLMTVRYGAEYDQLV